MDNPKYNNKMISQTIINPDPDLEKFNHRGTVLIFLPNTNELQRFILSGAFKELNKDHELHYVLPSHEAEKMRAIVPDILTSLNTSELTVSPERFAKWSRLFQAACFRYANLSPSFAIRASFALQQSNSRFFKILPKLMWAPLSRIIKYCLKFKYWPQRIQRFLNNWHIVLTEAVTNPEQFDLVHEEKYNTFVEATMRDVKPLQEIINLFDYFNPLFCIVPTSLLDLFCNDVIWACEAENVGCVILQSGWDNLSSKGIVYKRSAFLGCWGPQSAHHANKIQNIPNSYIHHLGAPHYELLKPASQEEIQQTRTTLGVHENEHLILFGGSFRQFDETGILLYLDKAIDEGRLGSVKILYRPHPWRAARQHEENFFKHQWKHILFDPDMRDRYLREQNEKGYIKRNVPIFDMFYLSQILSAVDAVISPMSTLLIESLILKKPTMAIAFDDGKHNHDPSITSQMTHFAEIKAAKNALIWCDNKKQFINDCLRLLKLKNSKKALEISDKLLAQIVTQKPDTYAERLAHFCRETVEPAARKLRGVRTGIKRGTISHAYGAHRIAQNYCDLELNNPVIPGYWMHGWIPSYHNMDPAFIALHKKEGQHKDYDYEAQINDEKENVSQWVSRQDQAEYLISHGYKQVKAIGLPIIYLPKSTVRRVPGSLLVMPPHSHKTHGPDDPLAEHYAKMIADLKPKFEHIWVGLNEDDIAKKQWIESFQRQGIHIFNTTDQANPDTLSRLKEILSTFEYVTTNGYGSHIALAAYCGAKVSIYGPYADFPIERMKTTHAVKMFPKLLKQAYYLCTEEALQKHYPFLFIEPDKASLHQEWGAQEVGEPCRLSPKELATLFQWEMKSMDQPINFQVETQ